MTAREHEMLQFEALGQMTEDCAEAIGRAWRRPAPSRSREHNDVRSTSELAALALPLEDSGPRLA